MLKKLRAVWRLAVDLAGETEEMSQRPSEKMVKDLRTNLNLRRDWVTESPWMSGHPSSVTPLSLVEPPDSSSTSNPPALDLSSKNLKLYQFPSDREELATLIRDYLNDRHCTLWGGQWSIAGDEDAKDKAIEFVIKLIRDLDNTHNVHLDE